MKLINYMSMAMIATATAVNSALATYTSNSPFLPPADGHYLSTPGEFSSYGGLPIILQNIDHNGFTNIQYTPIFGGTQDNFDSVVNADVSVANGPFTPISLTGPVSVALLNNYTPGATGTFNTEMLAMNLAGGPGILIRESPTLQSIGSTTVAPIGGGLFQIDSFFDVFTELSLDGGQSWIPDSAGPHRVVLSNLPEPTSLGLLGLGGMMTLLRKRKN